MGMRAGLRSKGFLDPKECWELWHKTGSLNGVQNYFVQHGRLNPKTGNPPTKAGIEKAAFSWVLENQEQARIDLSHAWKAEGEILTDEKWKEFLFGVSKLVYHQRPGKFERFVVSNELEDFME